MEKRRLYNQRVIEMDGSFGPLVFTPYDGVNQETELLMKILSVKGPKSGEQKNLEYDFVTNWIRSRNF